MQQSRLNDEMVQGGSKRYQQLVLDAQRREQNSVTPYGQRLLNHYLTPVSKVLKELFKYRGRGHAHSKDKIIAEAGITPEQMGLIGLHIVLDRLNRRMTFSALSHEIGRRVEDEHRYNYLKKAAPAFYRKLKKQVESKKTQLYRRNRETILLAMRRAEEQGDYSHRGKNVSYNSPPFKPWDQEVVARVGGAILTTILKQTDLVEVDVERRGVRTTKIVVPTYRTLQWINDFNDWCALNKPTWMPTVEVPVDWSNPYGGGYDGQQISPIAIMKSRNNQYVGSLVKENMPDVYNAMNALQQTAWRVNQRVLDVAKHVWNQGQGGLAGLPSRLEPIDFYLPPKPHDIDTNEEARKAWRQAAAKVHTWYREEKGRNIQVANTLHYATKFRKEDRIYFPYQLDFRGRTYTVPSFLSPQGNDLAKGLLLFADGKPLGDQHAVDWLAIAGANLYGEDKLSYDDRVAWTLSHRKEIESVVQDPLENTWWQEADGGDSAFTFLAWCFEWVGYLKQGYAYVCRHPLALDASNNGLQLLSLLCRDEVSGFSTNCLPTDKPEDIYTDVAKLVIDNLTTAADPATDDPDEPKARFWLNYGVDRKTCKRPVMVFPYGGTMQSCTQYVKEWFAGKERSLARDGKSSGLSEKQQFDYCIYLSKHVWKALNTLVQRPKTVMEWLQTASHKFTDAGKPMIWTVPTGLPIRQDYLNTRAKRVAIEMMGLQVQVNTRLPTKTYDRKRQKNGISPNYVHSLDAAILHMVVARAKELGIENFSMIHDSYGVLPSDTTVMVAVVRQVFKQTFMEDLLDTLKDEWEQQLGEPLPDLPEYGTMNVEDLESSEYLFS